LPVAFQYERVVHSFSLLQFGKNNQKINYLNVGFSEVHRFQYAGSDEKPIISQITEDNASRNQNNNRSIFLEYYRNNQ